MTLLATRASKLLLALLLTLAAVAAGAGGASAKVLQTADAEHTLNQDWASTSCADASRVKQVTSPVAQGKRAYSVSLKDGDYSWGERCEIGMGNPGRPGFPLFHEGDDRWISFQVYLPDDYPIDTHMWDVFFQIHQEGDGGCPPISLLVRDGQWEMENTTRNTYVLNTRKIWSAPAQRNHWAKFTLHIKNSPDDSVGFVELYGDLDGNGVKPLLERTYTHTMTKYANGQAMTNHARVGIYRDPQIRGDAHILFDGFTISTDRASAEGNAFAGVDSSGNNGASSQPPADNSSPVSPKKRSRVWLRTNGAARAAGTNWPRVVRVYGGVRPGPSAARRSVMIQVRLNGRWEWLARSWVHRNGRFYIAANVDPSLTGRRVKLRAVVAGVGHSKSLTARV
ncbi:MAG: hypothetical protein QOF55_13 [Thermoleophilaceae bacterium]|jgi:hypothetical protein|nr:hypothetical protein [Thermoleophilaceae bacterium]